MQNSRHCTASLVALRSRFGLLLLLIVFVLIGAGCKGNTHSSDPQMRPIEQSLDQHLPAGTPMDRVAFFLNSRGYELELSAKPNTLVAIIHHVDTETLQPATARVTFHFNTSEHLTSYDLAPAPDTAPHP